MKPPPPSLKLTLKKQSGAGRGRVSLKIKSDRICFQDTSPIFKYCLLHFESIHSRSTQTSRNLANFQKPGKEKQFNSNLQKPTYNMQWQWAGTHCSQMSPHGDLFWDLGPLWVPLFTILGPLWVPFSQFWAPFESPFLQFWVPFGFPLLQLWAPLFTILGPL